MSNPLRALFPATEASRASVVWPNGEADRGFIICFTGRCGSTELVDVLSQSGLCGQPDEYFNEEFIPYHNLQWQCQELSEYVRHLVQYRSAGRVFGFKIDGFRHRRLCELVDPECFFPRSAFQYFFMTRRNLTEQAFSYASAKATGVWHIKQDSEQPVTHAQASPTLTDQQVWKEFALILEQEFYFERIFIEQSIQATRIDYEMLCASKLSTVSEIMLRMGSSPEQIQSALVSSKQNLIKISYGGARQLQMLEFRKRFEAQIQYLTRNRGRLPYASVRNYLLLETKIDISQV